MNSSAKKVGNRKQKPKVTAMEAFSPPVCDIVSHPVTQHAGAMVHFLSMHSS